MEKYQALIDEFNTYDDYMIMLVLAGEKMSDEEKMACMLGAKTRLYTMDKKIFLQTLTLLEASLCESLKIYLKELLADLSIKDLEGIIYQNKYYHTVSELAKLLVKEDWFKDDRDHQVFILAVNLEKIFKEKCADNKTLEDIGILIINNLTNKSNNPEVFDMIMRNYLYLLETYYPSFVSNFQKFGYEVINSYLSEEKELNANMVIFDCAIMRVINHTNVNHFEFYDGNETVDGNAFAYAHAGTVRINTAAIKDIYQEYANKMIATQIIFYVIGHEIDHVFCERYKGDDNPYLDLKCYNSGISEALHNMKEKEFYHDYHNCFANEYQANIAGIKSLYQRYELLPCIKKEEKEEVSKLLASVLFSSYCKVEGKEFEGYYGPVEFTRSFFDEYKEVIPGYARHCLYKGQLELPSDLKEYEDNLSDYDKFTLGYYNKYIGILALISKGIIKTDNLLDNIDKLYEEYKEKCGYYPPYEENTYPHK